MPRLTAVLVTTVAILLAAFAWYAMAQVRAMEGQMAAMAGQLHEMDAQLGHVAVGLRSLDRMDRKLSETNRLLLTTNASLVTMIRASDAANAQLRSMRSDLAVMSHKISGSFLFRGVK